MRARPYGERIQHIAPCDCVDGRPLARLDNWRSVLRERDFRRAGSFWRLSLSCCFDTALQSKCQLCFGGNVQLGVWVAMIFRLKKTDVLLGFFFRANHSSVFLTQGARRPFDFQKNSPPTGHVFFGAKWHGEQCLLKSFCSLWRKRVSDFEKKLFGY